MKFVILKVQADLLQACALMSTGYEMKNPKLI